MNEEHEIIQRIAVAQKDPQAADQLIADYLPFIQAEAAKYRKDFSGGEDELSIAMLAFYEAIRSYSSARGAFLPYASLRIRSRLIDYHRKERRHQQVVSLHAEEGEDRLPLEQTLADQKDHHGELVVRDATRAEIEELVRQMQGFGIGLNDVADNCPKQQRTLNACQKALEYARTAPGLLEELLQTKRLPMTKLAQGSGVERKTLERHRKYLVALLLIYTNGYEIIRGHLKQVWKGAAVQ